MFSLTVLALGTVKGMYPAVPEEESETAEMSPETLSTVAVRTAPEESRSSCSLNCVHKSSNLFDCCRCCCWVATMTIVVRNGQKEAQGRGHERGGVIHDGDARMKRP